ncbi:hypothetical protein C1I93_09375 [Micromonospora endophytica]|uniref:Uncharacterized protein n=1 Tax=Micromonospora endophytica TaxID=515350 RepID=A0A2W2CK38_9ACTN|nr:hypothetical protein C1I93_09375 [Micromonospora endophytica]RIW42744.1 hypothetical protein D3H59_22170 [Micromonospora endophytica]
MPAASCREADTTATSEQIASAMLHVESYFIRRLLIGRATASINRIPLRIVTDMRAEVRSSHSGTAFRCRGVDPARRPAPAGRASAVPPPRLLVGSPCRGHRPRGTDRTPRLVLPAGGESGILKRGRTLNRMERDPFV